MRGNGLTAQTYVVLATDLEPPTTDRLLGVLQDAGIAAYAEPGTPAPSVAFEIPSSPTTLERLHVDEAHADIANELIDAELIGEQPADAADGPDGDQNDPSSLTTPSRPDTMDRETTDLDEERAWSEIVAAFDQEPSDPVPRWPVSEDTTSDSDASETADSDAGSAESGSSIVDDIDPRPKSGTSVSAPEPDGFVPPTPPPLPRLDPVTKAAWVGALGGPGVMLAAVLLQVSLPSWLVAACVAAFIGGLIALFMRLKSGPPDEDDGAVL